MIATSIPPAWREKLAALEGLISEEVGLTLAGLAEDVRRSCAIVEIGSYVGKSAAYLATGAKWGEGAPVFCIDPWDLEGNPGGRFGFNSPNVLKRFLEQIRSAGVEDQITPIRAFAKDLARHWIRPIALLYIDGSHTEADVRQDWRLWSRFLVRGGVVVFDDYRTERNPGVAAVVDSSELRSRISDWTMMPAPLAIGRMP